jgi:hypothetical protein
MPFNPNLDNSISLEDAAKITANFRQAFPTAVIANAYGKRQMQELLEQENCEGFRIYNGIDDEGSQQLIIVGVDASGNDLYEGVLIDHTQPCPSICSTANVLNTNT